MADKFTGVRRVLGLSSTILDKVHREKKIAISELSGQFTYYPHMFLVLKNGAENQSALCKVSANAKWAVLLDTNISVSDITPRNKEQIMAFSMLMDDDVPLNILTGRAGTGKTLLTLAVALQKIGDRKYDKLILTRPMSQVGRRDLGALPGDVRDKFGPYLMNYMSNLEFLVGPKNVGHAISQAKIEFMPLQLIRGASFFNTFVIADESQVLGYHEMLTLGTRIGQNSKLVVMGDLNQRDEKIARDKTGIHKLMQDRLIKESPLASAIELIKVERSEIAKLFAETFEE